MAVTSKHLVPVVCALGLAGCGSAQTAETPKAQSSREAVTTSSSSAPTPDIRPVIVAFGDSLSAGFGLDPGKSFPDDLQRLIDARGYKYNVVNMGVSGDTTTDGLERLSSVLALKPAIVILEFGGNDGLRGQPVASAKQNMAVMIERLQAAGAKVLIAGMTLPRNYGPEYIHSFEKMYTDLAAQYKLARIPFLLEGVGGVREFTQSDGLHPTAKGAEMVAATVMRYLVPLLGT